MTIEARLKSIVATVMGIPESMISTDLSPDLLEKWNSLRHMNLVTAVEEEFNIVFEYDEIVQVMEYRILEEIVRRKLES